jgi:hypothetical protein
MHIIDTYYDILAAFDAERLRAILAEDLVFEGPIAGRRIGAEGFVAGAGAFAGALRELTMVQRLDADDQAAALYDAHLPGGVMRFAEFFTVTGGRIQTLRLHYDAAQYRTTMAG